MKKKESPRQREERRQTPGVEAFLEEARTRFDSWMEDPAPALARASSLSPEENEQVFLSLIKSREEEVFPFFQSLMGREERVDLALAASLGKWKSGEAGILLHRLASKSSSKAVLKGVRKAIFALRSQGVEVEEMGESAPPAYRPPQAIPAEGLVSSLDAAGMRFVWLALPQPPQGIAAFHALVSDEEGIVDFQGFETSRKKFHDYLGQFRRNVPYDIVEAEPDYCLGLLGEAAETTRKAEKPLPEAFLEARPALGTPPQLPLRPLIYRHLDEEETRGRADLLEQCAALFQDPSFQTWFLEAEEVEKYLGLMKEASESKLVLTPYQKEGRFLEIHRQAVEELFGKERRLLFRRRLEEMAYVLWKLGREKEARISLAAGLGMEAEAGVLTPHPFLLELVKRSLAAGLEKEAKEQRQKEDDLLIKP